MQEKGIAKCGAAKSQITLLKIQLARCLQNICHYIFVTFCRFCLIGITFSSAQIPLMMHSKINFNH